MQWAAARKYLAISSRPLEISISKTPKPGMVSLFDSPSWQGYCPFSSCHAANFSAAKAVALPIQFAQKLRVHYPVPFFPNEQRPHKTKTRFFPGAKTNLLTIHDD